MTIVVANRVAIMMAIMVAIMVAIMMAIMVAIMLLKYIRSIVRASFLIKSRGVSISPDVFHQHALKTEGNHWEHPDDSIFFFLS